MADLKRMWINQPSTLQPHHGLNGKNVLAEVLSPVYARVWFTEGNIISMEIARRCLSEGWRPQPTQGG